MEQRDLHVERIPLDLLRAARSAAALEGMTLRKYIIRLLEQATRPKGGKR